MHYDMDFTCICTCIFFSFFRFAEFVTTGKHFNEEELQIYDLIGEDSSYSLFSELEDSELDEEQPACSTPDVNTWRHFKYYIIL